MHQRFDVALTSFSSEKKKVDLHFLFSLENDVINLVPRVFSLFNMAAAREKTLAHSDLKRSLIGAILT